MGDLDFLRFTRASYDAIAAVAPAIAAAGVLARKPLGGNR
jgi:hypothetical protein